MDARIVVGWTCTAIGAVVLAASAWSFAALARMRAADRVGPRFGGRDALLLLAWGGVLAGGPGLLAGRAWSRWTLTVGVAGVVAWALFSAAVRTHVAYTMGDAVPVNRRAAVVGNLGPALAVAALAAWLLGWLHGPALEAALR
ncbi:MAG: hypothetical protein AB1941_10485 [Gemmatimonadota bacterium]